MRTNEINRTTASLQIVALAATLLVAGLLAWHPLEDLDVWFHLRAGSDLLAHGPLPALNHYSFTEPGHPWLDHEWLFQLLIRSTGPHAAPPLLDAGGWNVLRLILVCALVAILALGDGGARRARGHGTPAAAAGALVALLVSLGLLWPRLLLRPELVSYALLVPLVRWTEALGAAIARDGGTAAPARRLVDPRHPAGRLLWLICLWAQAHGFAGIAPLLVGVGLAGAALAARPRRGGTWPAVGRLVAGSLVALMVTPNGWQGLAFPLRALGQFHGGNVDLRGTIAELAPLLQSPDSLSGTIRLFQISLVAGAAIVGLGWRHLGVLRPTLWAAMAAATLLSQRALGPYAVAFALLALRAQLPAIRARNGSSNARAGHPAPALVLAGLALAGAAWWANGIVSDRFYLHEGVARRFGNGLATAQYPLAAAGALEGQPPARVFANLGATGLLLGTTRAEVYIDGRTEAYSPGLWREYAEIRRGGEHALALLDARRVQYVCLAAPQGPFAALVESLLASHRWQLVAADGAGLLLRRESLEPGPDTAPEQDRQKRERLLAAARTQQEAAAAGGLSPARSADAWLAAAGLYGLVRDEAGQRGCLETAVGRSPKHPLAHHNLGCTLLAAGRPAEALPHFQSAASLNRRLQGSRLNAGVCLMRLDRAGEAIPWFRDAVSLNRRSPEAWANLAIGLVATGDRAGAIAASERALALSPADPRLNRLRDSLRRGGPAQ